MIKLRFTETEADIIQWTVRLAGIEEGPTPDGEMLEDLANYIKTELEAQSESTGTTITTG